MPRSRDPGGQGQGRGDGRMGGSACRPIQHSSGQQIAAGALSNPGAPATACRVAPGEVCSPRWSGREELPDVRDRGERDEVLGAVLGRAFAAVGDVGDE
eukprot:643112-Pyramimonas_sp.AAC.1